MTELLLPRKTRPLDLGVRLHGVPDEIVMAGLREDLDSFCGEPVVGVGWYACVLFADGRGFLGGPELWCAEPGEDKRDLMVRLARRLNREMAHGGHWVTAWHSEGHLVVLWRDVDGDLQFTTEFDDAWERFRHQSDEDTLAVCQASYDEWYERVHHWVDVRPQETKKRAQGQTRPGE